jgi:hypothetical protein
VIKASAGYGHCHSAWSCAVRPQSSTSRVERNCTEVVSDEG